MLLQTGSAMTLQEILQILGGIGVIASMIFVGIQIRNNAKAVRAATYQQLSASVSAPWDNFFNNAESCSLALRGGDNFESLDRLEKARYRFMLMATLRRYENAWFQHRIGTLKRDEWLGLNANLEAIFGAPGNHSAWALIRDRSNAKFRSFIDDLVKRTAPIAAAYLPPKTLIRKSKSRSRKG